MFRVSPDSSQIDLFGNVEQFLSPRQLEKLNDPDAWHNVFLDQVTKRIPEARFAELFDDSTGRPNASIRVLVAMLIIKEGFGWSDGRLGRIPNFPCHVEAGMKDGFAMVFSKFQRPALK